jgi:hypothetical protein
MNQVCQVRSREAGDRSLSPALFGNAGRPLKNDVLPHEWSLFHHTNPHFSRLLFERAYGRSGGAGTLACRVGTRTDTSFASRPSVEKSLDAAGTRAQCHILFDCRLAKTWVAPASAGARAAKAAGHATKNDGLLRVTLKTSSTHRLKPMPPMPPNEKYVALGTSARASLSQQPVRKADKL